MAQVVARIDDALADSVDQLIADGAAASRSDAVRQGLEFLTDRHRRARIADAIVRGYLAQPQTEDDGAWADDATVAMITDEPW